jgi:hypothetical protein
MTLDDAADHCEAAFAAYASRNNIRRDEPFYIMKMQEELGELTRHYLEMTGREAPSGEQRREFEGDCASLVGNALILAKRFGVDLPARLKEKFPLTPPR